MAIFVNGVQTPEGRQEPATAQRSAESGMTNVRKGSGVTGMPSTASLSGKGLLIAASHSGFGENGVVWAGPSDRMNEGPLNAIDFALPHPIQRPLQQIIQLQLSGLAPSRVWRDQR
jgi:hypothetical protein